MTEPTEAARIVKSLLERTAKGELSWVQEAENPGEYRASTARFNYYVASRDLDGQHPYKLEVWRKGGDLGGGENVRVLDMLGVGSFVSAADDLSALFYAARQSSLGLRGSLADEVLRDLDDHLPF